MTQTESSSRKRKLFRSVTTLFGKRQSLLLPPYLNHSTGVVRADIYCTFSREKGNSTFYIKKTDKYFQVK